MDYRSDGIGEFLSKKLFLKISKDRRLFLLNLCEPREEDGHLSL